MITKEEYQSAVQTIKEYRAQLFAELREADELLAPFSNERRLQYVDIINGDFIVKKEIKENLQLEYLEYEWYRTKQQTKNYLREFTLEDVNMHVIIKFRLCQNVGEKTMMDFIDTLGKYGVSVSYRKRYESLEFDYHNVSFEELKNAR